MANKLVISFPASTTLFKHLNFICLVSVLLMDEEIMQVIGIPWDVDTEGLRRYMSKFGELDDCIVMKVWILFFLFFTCKIMMMWPYAFCLFRTILPTNHYLNYNYQFNQSAILILKINIACCGVCHELALTRCA